MTDILDTAAVAELAGIKRETVHTYLARGTIPQPDLRIGASPAWLSSTIWSWLASRPGVGQHRS